MAAPSVTALGTPTGIKLDDGFRTAIAFARNPNVSLWEKTVTPPGLDGGDAIQTATMRNNRWRTKAPRSLIEMTEMSFVAAYDPAIYDDILDLLNEEGAITVHFPDGSTLSFYGYLRVFEPQEVSEGEQPEANVTIEITNQDPVTGAEEDPVMVAVVGT